MQISQWWAARIFFLFSSFFKNTISSSCTRNFNFMRPALQFFLGKNTNFCYIIHLKIISVSSTPFAKNHLVTFACINFVLLKTLMALISIACAIVQCFNKQWLKLWWMASILDTFRELEKLKNGALRSAAISFRSWLLWLHLHILVTLDIIKRLTWGCTWWRMRSGRCSWSRVKGQLKIVSGRWFGKHPVHH